MESARVATIDDAERLIDLQAMLQAELAIMRGGEIWAQREAAPKLDADTLQKLLEDPQATVIVGEVAGSVIGFAIVHNETLRDGRVLTVVPDVFVEPEARSVGVGEEIVKHIESFAREHHAIGIDATALPGNRDTKNFFEGQGFTARSLIMHHSLAEN